MSDLELELHMYLQQWFQSLFRNRVAASFPHSDGKSWTGDGVRDLQMEESREAGIPGCRATSVWRGSWWRTGVSRPGGDDSRGDTSQLGWRQDCWCMAGDRDAEMRWHRLNDVSSGANYAEFEADKWKFICSWTEGLSGLNYCILFGFSYAHILQFLCSRMRLVK